MSTPTPKRESATIAPFEFEVIITTKVDGIVKNETTATTSSLARLSNIYQALAGALAEATREADS